MNQHYSVSTSYPSTYEKQQWMPEHRNSLRKSSPLSGIKVAIVALFLVLPWIPYAAVRMSFNGSESRIHNFLDQRLQTANEVQEKNVQIRRLQEEERKTLDETGDLYKDLRTIGPLADSPEYAQVEELENRLLQQIDNFHTFIQTRCRTDLIRKYGRGQQRVAFDLDLQNDWKSSFVVELMPPHTMPHSIDLFLNLVSQQHWDGYTLLHRGDLKLGDPPASKVNARKESDMEPQSLLFLERSVERQTYALCFAAGSSSSFYFSLQDKPIREEDPCFGAVVESPRFLGRLPQKSIILGIRLVDQEETNHHHL
jgi:hypothetical protein